MKLILSVLTAAAVCGCAVVYEPDMRSGKTTVICHKSKQTLVLPDEAVPAHLGHGDTYGACPGHH